MITAKCISFESHGSVPAKSEEAEQLMALADAIEAKVSVVAERLLQRGEYVMASSVLAKMVESAETLRYLVEGHRERMQNHS